VEGLVLALAALGAVAALGQARRIERERERELGRRAPKGVKLTQS
jgi:hypothetical protein